MMDGEYISGLQMMHIVQKQIISCVQQFTTCTIEHKGDTYVLVHKNYI
jgi:hypothetical protein